MKSDLVVVIHGSALAASTPRDVDVIYIGDRETVAEVARTWATNRFGERGETLPLDMHESMSTNRIVVPAVPGRDTPYEVIAGEALPEDSPAEERAIFTIKWSRPAPYVTIEVTTYRGIASYLRSPLSPREMHERITSAVADGHPLTARFSLSEAVTGEWGEYCDGPRALRSGIAKCHCWEELKAIDPEFYSMLGTVAQHGDRNLSPTLREHFARSSGAIRQAGACVIDVFWRLSGPRTGPVVHATHSAVEWSLAGFTALLRGERAEPLEPCDIWGWRDYAKAGFPLPNTPRAPYSDTPSCARVAAYYVPDRSSILSLCERADVTVPQDATGEGVQLWTQILDANEPDVWSRIVAQM